MQTKWEKKKKINFLIVSVTITMVVEDEKSAKEEPQTFNNFWNHANPESQKMAWGHRKRIQQHEQARGMEENAQGSYAPKLCSYQVPIGIQDWLQRCVPHLTCSLWLQSSSQSQFLQKLSPVMNNIMLLALLLIMIHFRCLAKIVNIKTAFLYGDLEGQRCMKCPLGMNNVVKDDYLILGKCVYCLVQVAKQYNEKTVEIFGEVGI